MKFRFGVYKHYKGNKYLVIGLSKHSETLEPHVVYVSLYDNPESKMWVRPQKMFFENVSVNGVTQPRFQYVPEESQ